jgi:ribosomal protein S18 acetylase RimI-like enzyme
MDMSEDNKMVPPRIAVLSPAQAGAAGAVLARSHADYPSFRHLFPDPARRARALKATLSGIARDAARLGSAYGAIGDDGERYGVAIWLAPGRFPWSAWRQVRGAAWMLSVLRADPGSFRAFTRTGANAARLHPADPHWYLETMGVDPAVQRQGLGGRLIEPVLEIADRDQVDCYLETANPENAEYYVRHGFVVENATLQLVPSGPAHIAMRRRPVAAPGAGTDRARAVNLLSVGAAYGLLVLVFQEGVGNELLGFPQVDTIEAWVPLFLFAVLFGPSMDYHVLLLSRIRERFSQTGDNSDAIAHGVGSTGRISPGPR